MNATLLNGKDVAGQIRKELSKDITVFAETHAQKPGLSVLLVGHNPASETYVNAKIKACAEVGIQSYLHRFPETVSQAELLEKIHALNADPAVNGILVQLPLPKHIQVQAVLDAVDPQKDVDGFHPSNIGNMQVGRDALLPCTPYGVLRLLKEYNVDLQGKHAVIVGHSHIVGRPMATLLLNENATVSVCHAYTANLKEMTRMADVLIVAVGKKHLITKDMVKPGAVVVDVGINREENKLYGDCDFQGIQEVASLITPVPGGVGPMTIAMLLENTLAAAKVQAERVVRV